VKFWKCPHCGYRCRRQVRRTVIHGRRLAAIRRDRGLTQWELGSAVHKSKQTIASWESQGSAVVRSTDARQCAAALRCRVKDLAAPLEVALPPAPASWHRMRLQAARRRRQAKLVAAAATGEPPLWVRRFAERPSASAQ
jgi:DNA-binding XRE family transcriptional regulator